MVHTFLRIVLITYGTEFFHILAYGADFYTYIFQLTYFLHIIIGLSNITSLTTFT